ncbi:9230_t:CDS:2, partial [Racocetra fulgida]
LLQALSQPLLSPEEPEAEIFNPQELTEEINEKQQALAAHKKQMTFLTLLIILFLLEKVVYDKNGLLESYALMIGFIVGNALAYSALEKKEH